MQLLDYGKLTLEGNDDEKGRKGVWGANIWVIFCTGCIASDCNVLVLGLAPLVQYGLRCNIGVLERSSMYAKHNNLHSLVYTSLAAVDARSLEGALQCKAANHRRRTPPALPPRHQKHHPTAVSDQGLGITKGHQSSHSPGP